MNAQNHLAAASDSNFKTSTIGGSSAFCFYAEVVMGLHTCPIEPGDDGDPYEGYVHEDRVEEIFIAGLQAMREMLARFVEQGGTSAEKTIAESMRLNWNPSWGKDPGKPETVIDDCWSA